MFVRVKKSGAYQYLQIVHNERVDGRVQQHVIATLVQVLHIFGLEMELK